jgi:hypothetical protein
MDDELREWMRKAWDEGNTAGWDDSQDTNRMFREGPTKNPYTCEECGGTGLTIQGWTDKNGHPEDQYGPCASCAAATSETRGGGQ